MREPAFTSAVRLVEEALALTKRVNAAAWSIYLLGLTPFFGFLLFALTDLSQNPFALNHLLSFAFILTALYYWLHICQSVFCALLYATLTENHRPIGGYFSIAVRVQPVLAGAKLLAWPAALLLLVPYSVVTSFFQHSLLSPIRSQNADWRATISTARADARYRPLIALWALVIVLLLRIVLWLNLLSLLFVLPQFWKLFTGIEGNVTRSPEVLLNPTSITALCALAYIGLDPIAKAMFVLRRFARQSETSGDDLRLRFTLARKTIVAAILLLVVFMVPCRTSAQQRPVPRTTPASITPGQMKQAIRSVFRDPANTWNLPVIEHKNQKKDAFTAFMDSVVNGIDKVWDSVTSAISNVIGWIRRLFSNGKTPAHNESKAVSRRDAIVVLACFGGLLLIAILIGAWERRERPKLQFTAAVAAPASKMDLNSEDADPLEQSVNEWHKLAKQYRTNGDFRLALRALYLGTLATLAEHNLLSPARGKTNAEYLRELQRRAKRLGAEFVSAFTANTRVFERSWYGTYPATDAMVEQFEQNVTAMRERLL